MNTRGASEPSAYWLPMNNLHEHIATLAKLQPTRAALVVCGPDGTTLEEITYGNLYERIAAVAAGLQSQGLRPGDRVALALSSVADQLILTWAAWASGISVVPLDSKRDTKELQEFKLSLSRVKAVLHELPSAGSTPPTWMPDLSHEALILFTSGTTAHPKGAQLSLSNMVTNAEGIKDWLQVGAEDRFMVVLPLHHINSTTFCLATLLAGGTIAVPPGYSNSGFWGQAAKTGATFTSIVQSIVFDQLNRTADYARVGADLRLSRIQIGSAPVVVSAAQKFIRTFGIPLYQGYGQTETALRVTGVPMDLPPAAYAQLIEENSIGMPMPWATVEIMDEQGVVLGEGEEGELAVKGPAVMAGYLGQEPAFRDGYFLTGDIGYYKNLEGRRFFYLIGRKKEILIKGGVNISPVAVENALQRVSDAIEQAYVVPVADERYGEEVGAVVCWNEGNEPVVAMRQLKARLLLGSAHISRYETPSYIAALPASELPTTSTGKVQRALLKERISTWEPSGSLFETEKYRFVVVLPHAPLAPASLALYNHCWQPLLLDAEAYAAFLQKNTTLAAVDAAGNIAGQISFAVKNGVPTCVSICSNAYRPKPVPDVAVVPTPEEVEEYVRAGHDPVINFHTKLGAKVVEVIPQGRPEDKSALGYTTLLRYAVPSEPVRVDAAAPVSQQLIHAVLLLAQDAGLPSVDALSRPGGLAAYLVQKHA